MSHGLRPRWRIDFFFSLQLRSWIGDSLLNLLALLFLFDDDEGMDLN